MTAFTGFCTLRHLDLKLGGAQYIFRCDAKATGGNLLDCAVPPFTILVRGVALRILTTFATVRASAKPIHGYRKGLVGFFGQRAERHCAGAKSFYDLCC